MYVFMYPFIFLFIHFIYGSITLSQGAAEAVLEVVTQLPGWAGGGGLSGDLCITAAPNRRHLHVLALTRSQCLQFATTLLIHALRQRIIIDRHSDDLCIGHLITLLQVSKCALHMYHFAAGFD